MSSTSRGRRLRRGLRLPFLVKNALLDVAVLCELDELAFELVGLELRARVNLPRRVILDREAFEPTRAVLRALDGAPLAVVPDGVAVELARFVRGTHHDPALLVVRHRLAIEFAGLVGRDGERAPLRVSDHRA